MAANPMNIISADAGVFVGRGTCIIPDINRRLYQ
jgi:hypothetical protein